LWHQGEAATATAKAQHDRAVTQAQKDAATKSAAGIPTVAPFIPFVDPSEAKRQAARTMLDHARPCSCALRSAGDAAEKTVGVWRDKAPEKPDFWSQVGDVFSSAGSDVLHGLEDFGAGVVNAAASFGNAAINHPGDLALTPWSPSRAAADRARIRASNPGCHRIRCSRRSIPVAHQRASIASTLPRFPVSNYTSIPKTARRLTSMGVGSMAEPS
jgi:hypothetical protein